MRKCFCGDVGDFAISWQLKGAGRISHILDHVGMSFAYLTCCEVCLWSETLRNLIHRPRPYLQHIPHLLLLLTSIVIEQLEAKTSVLINAFSGCNNFCCRILRRRKCINFLQYKLKTIDCMQTWRSKCFLDHFKLIRPSFQFDEQLMAFAE